METFMLDEALMEILACPKCKGPVHYNDNKTGLSCDACHLEYPIRDDIPVMLIDEARDTKA
ncbi:MAG TPA: Trm112 family protein, partial [Mariprofundaceae bacterium]|nr:Trm112 family protein [Mariprofundaceae bacterium]